MRSFLVVLLVVPLASCELMGPASCPPGSSPLAGNIGSKADGSAVVKLSTPEGGVEIPAVEKGNVPVKLTAEVKAGLQREMNSRCLATALVESVAANPEKWTFKQEADGSFTLSSR
jgi:hypothetical protein